MSKKYKYKTEDGKKKPTKGFLGGHHSKEVKEKIGFTHRGKPLTNAHKTKISNALKRFLEDEKNREQRSIRNRGERHWNWKGGRQLLRQSIRGSFKYRQWRSDCFTRDNFICVNCGLRSGSGKAVYLEVDHYPKMFSTILDEYGIRSLEQALNCEELWSINNGRTLCIECHNKTKK